MNGIASFDVLSVLGLLLGVGAILLGQYIEGGQVAALLNGPALLIVVGGTLGAALLQSPLATVRRTLAIFGWVFRPPVLPVEQAREALLGWSRIARREGLLALERPMQQQADPFLRKGLQLLIDGNEPETIRRTLELDISARETRDLDAARVLEGMGGYAPTIGIIGAVLGLISVMKNLSDPSLLGQGIAVAFVATIYGVALANLVLLPAAHKLKAHVHRRAQFQEVCLEGLVAIAEGENPRVIESRLQGMVG